MAGQLLFITMSFIILHYFLDYDRYKLVRGCEKPCMSGGYSCKQSLYFSSMLSIYNSLTTGPGQHDILAGKENTDVFICHEHGKSFGDPFSQC